MPCTYPHWKLTAFPGHCWILHGYNSPSLALCAGRAWIPGDTWWPRVMQKVVSSAHQICEALDRPSFLMLAVIFTPPVVDEQVECQKIFRTGIGDQTQLPAIRICNIVISGALHRALVPPSIGMGQERATKCLRIWSGGSILIYQRLGEGPVRTRYQIQRQGLNDAVTDNIYDLGLIRWEEEPVWLAEWHIF